MKYCKIISDIVIQTQRSPGLDFIECPEHVSCGMIKIGENYSPPSIIPKSTAEIAAEIEAEAEEKLNLNPKTKVILKQIFLLRKTNGESITQTQFLDELKADYKAFK